MISWNELMVSSLEICIIDYSIWFVDSRLHLQSICSTPLLQVINRHITKLHRSYFLYLEYTLFDRLALIILRYFGIYNPFLIRIPRDELMMLNIGGNITITLIRCFDILITSIPFNRWMYDFLGNHILWLIHTFACLVTLHILKINVSKALTYEPFRAILS